VEETVFIEQAGARVERIQDPYSPADPRVFGIARWIRVGVRVFPDSVAYVGWTQKRQHQIRTGPQAPSAQGLAEVLVVFVQPRVRRRIEQAGKADGCVEQQASRVIQRGFEFCL